MPSLQLLERGPAGAGILDRPPLGGIGKEIEPAIHRDLPASRAVKNQGACPDVVVVDPCRGREASPKGLHTVKWYLGFENRQKTCGVHAKHDGRAGEEPDHRAYTAHRLLSVAAGPIEHA